MTTEETAIWNLMRSMNQFCYISPDGSTLYVAVHDGRLIKLTGRDFKKMTGVELIAFMNDNLNLVTV